MSPSLERFRKTAILEGYSFLVLLFVAMPLKYALGKPMPVKVVGWLHGVLFILYILWGARAAREEGWSLGFCAKAFIASLIPFGTFVLDKHLRAMASKPTDTPG